MAVKRTVVAYHRVDADTHAAMLERARLDGVSMARMYDIAARYFLATTSPLGPRGPEDWYLEATTPPHDR